MKFYCGTQEWDTDSPVYVLGYQICKSWYALEKDRPKSSLDFGISCRKEYISQLVIGHDGGRSWVEDFILTSKDGYTHLNYQSFIVATSAKKAKEIHKELLQEKAKGGS